MDFQSNRDKITSNISYFALSLVISAIIAIPFFFLTLFIALFLFPAISTDGHPVMPMVQFAASILLTFIFSAILLIYLFKKIQRKFRQL